MKTKITRVWIVENHLSKSEDEQYKCEITFENEINEEFKFRISNESLKVIMLVLSKEIFDKADNLAESLKESFKIEI